MSQSYNALIVSHSSRIQCLLAKMGVRGNIIFQNCCILKITLVEQDSIKITIQLLYSGDISDKDRKNTKKIFYSNEDLNVPNKKFVKFNEFTTNMDKNKMGLQNVVLRNPYVFYLIRHGQSEHNEYSMFNPHLLRDTKLTPAGIKSATKAKIALEDIIRQDSATLNGLFVSDLIRTRETLKLLTNASYKDMTVIPCASEVGDAGKNGDCDALPFWKKMAQENYPKCTRKDIGTTEKCTANWNTYLHFYGNQMRGSKRMKCRDTNMIAMAIYVLGFKHMSLDAFTSLESIGGTKLNRKRTNIDHKKCGLLYDMTKTKRMRSPCCRIASRKKRQTSGLQKNLTRN